MNSIEAKKLNLPEIMSRLGYEPTSIKKNGGEYWYNSPFRAEKDASFHTSYLGGKWIWKDFGDSGGTVIDFIMRHQRLNTVSEALTFLEGFTNKIGKPLTQSSSFSFQQQKPSRSENFDFKDLAFVSAQPITNRIIISYLTEQRGITKDIALNYLEEVKYKNLKTNKEYFAFGIKNESDGYEIRVASDNYPFKSSLIEKDITIIKGFKTNGVANVFEGTTDFLSLLTMLKTDNLHGDSILMHSANSSYDRTLKAIQANNYTAVNLFLDNDQTGRKQTAQFTQDLGDIVTNQSTMFLPFMDINEMLQNQIKGLAKQNIFNR